VGARTPEAFVTRRPLAGAPSTRRTRYPHPVTAWPRRAKIAFVGSHGIRKTTAAYAFAHTIQRAGRSVEFGREVVRDNPLGINETATGEAQLWVLVSQVRQELELAPKAEVLVTDRGVVDNYAYYLRACGGVDRFDIEPLVRNWGGTYDLVVRLMPDIPLREDGIRTTNNAFRELIEGILDDVLPTFVGPDRLVNLPASAITDSFDWWPLAERLAAAVGAPLLGDDVEAARRPRVRQRAPVPRPGAGEVQLDLELPPTKVHD
jgi:nicotinamide riboside kinase